MLALKYAATCFSVPEIRGFWRHRNDLQILPAPPEAPRPDAVLHEHPFVLEYRVRTSTNSTLGLTRRWNRLWQLHLLLSLLLRGSITRESLEAQHHWVLLHEPTRDGLHTAYLNEGYMVGGSFVARAEDFSDPAEVPSTAACMTPRWRLHARRSALGFFSMMRQARKTELLEDGTYGAHIPWLPATATIA